MVGGIFDGDRLSQSIAGTDPDSKFQLIVETLGWPDHRSGFCRWLELSGRTADRNARGNDAGSAAVIADRNVFVVREQRIVGTKLFSDICRVVDADIKISVVADARSKMERAFCSLNKAAFDFAGLGTVIRQQLGESRAQRSTRFFAEGKQFVEIRSARSLCRARRFRGEQTLRKCRSQVQD